MDIAEEARAFSETASQRGRNARCTAAFFLAFGIDLDEARASAHPERGRIVLRLERLIERERLRGMRGHWSYDLNRHIALTQAWRELASRDSVVSPQAAAGPRNGC